MIVFTSEIDSKYCSSCCQKRPLSSFYKDPSASLGSRVMATCAPCRATHERYRNRQKANQQLDPDMPPPKRRRLKTPLIPCLETPLPLANLPKSRLETPTYANPPELRLETLACIPIPPQPGFLPANQ